MKVLVIGHSSYDISCPVDQYPVENTKYRLDGCVMCGGGPAANAAFLLGKWGVETYYAGVVGSDDFGTKIKKEFETIGVKTDCLEVNYEKPTSISFIMINKQNGSRTLFNVATDRPNMKRYDFTMEPDIILTDGHEYQATMNAYNKYPNAIKIVDAGRITPELKEICKYSTYLVSSKGFAETITKTKIDYANPNTLVQVYTALKNNYPKSEIIVTLEDKGALYAVNNEIKIMPGLKLQPVDTTGCGDIFHGAFTYAISKGFDLEKCVRYANIAAGLSVQKIGARLSIPSLVEVSNYYNEKFPSTGGTASPQEPNQAPVQTTPQQGNPASTQNVDATAKQTAAPAPEVQNEFITEQAPVAPSVAVPDTPVMENTSVSNAFEVPSVSDAPQTPAPSNSVSETPVSTEEPVKKTISEMKW